MTDYVLHRYGDAFGRDPNGQPLRCFKANHENNVSKSIDILSGICTGILSDGTVNDREAEFFRDWVKKHTCYEPVWPFITILERLEKVFADGTIDEEERKELASIMKNIVGSNDRSSDPTERYSTQLPLDDPLPTTIVFSEMTFCITGRFAFGTRLKVCEATTSRGGSAHSNQPSGQTHYLVIGCFASRDWYNTNYGRKIERAVELRAEGKVISIISEEHWKEFIL